MNQIEEFIDRVAREYFPDPRKGIPAAGTYFAALLIAVVFVWPQVTGSGDRRLFLLFVAAIIALLLVRLWTVAAMFVLVQMIVLLRERPRAVSELSGNEIVFGLAVLVLVIAGCRLVALISPMVPPDSSLFTLVRTSWRRLSGNPDEDRHAVMPTRRGVTFNLSEGLTGLARAIGAVAVAAVLLAKFPLDVSDRETIGLFEWAVRPIKIGIILIIVFQVTRAVLGTLSWRRLTRSEAQVYLRSEFIEWPHRDVRGVVNRQVNQRRDRRRK